MTQPFPDQALAELKDNIVHGRLSGVGPTVVGMLLERLDAAEAVCRNYQWLQETIDRNVDPTDTPCLQNHGLIWNELDQALAVWRGWRTGEAGGVVTRN